VDGFTAMAIFFGVLAFGIFYALGRYHPMTGPEVLDWKPTRSYEDEVALELEDVEQMLEAQNARRRADGRPELTEEGLEAEVHRQLNDQRARARAYEDDQR
jgi:hypothetical protein